MATSTFISPQVDRGQPSNLQPVKRRVPTPDNILRATITLCSCWKD